MNNLQNNPNVNNLLNQASKQFSTSPDQLLKNAQSGQYDNLINKMKPQDAQKFKQILNNPELAQKMLQTPQAQMLIKQFMKNNGK